MEISPIVKEHNRMLSLVLYDSLQLTPKEYLELYQKCNISTDGIVYDFVDTTSEQGKWCYKLLLPSILPVTCIFSSSMELIDLLPGISKESLLYANDVIKNQKTNIDYHYNQQYDRDKMKIINWFNCILKTEMYTKNEQEFIGGVDSLFELHPNPYLLFLKMQKQLQIEDSIAAKETAKKILLFDSIKDICVYSNELKSASQLIDSRYNIRTGPFMKLETNQIVLTDCRINQAIDLHVNITNSGGIPLKISDIQTSCSCLTLLGHRKHIIEPGKSQVVDLRFIPDTEGDVHREICIASNSINLPISIITIEANVHPINN